MMRGDREAHIASELQAQSEAEVDNWPSWAEEAGTFGVGYIGWA